MSEYKKDGKKCFISNDMSFLKSRWNIGTVLSTITYYKKDDNTLEIIKYQEGSIQSNWEERISYVDYYKHNKRILIGEDYEWVPDESDPSTLVNTGLFLGAGSSEKIPSDRSYLYVTYKLDNSNHRIIITEESNTPPGLPTYLPAYLEDGFLTPELPRCYFIVLMGGGGGGAGGNWNTPGGGGGSGAIWIGIVRLGDKDEFNFKITEGGKGGYSDNSNGSSGADVEIRCGIESITVQGGGGGIYNGSGGSGGSVIYCSNYTYRPWDNYTTFTGDGPTMNRFYTLYWSNGSKGGSADNGSGSGGDNTYRKYSINSNILPYSSDTSYNLMYKYSVAQKGGASGQPNKGGGGGAGGFLVKLNWQNGGELVMGDGSPGMGGDGAGGSNRNGRNATAGSASHGGGGAGRAGWGSPGSSGGKGAAGMYYVGAFGSAGSE